MAYSGDDRNQYRPNAPAGHGLSHRISNLSEISDYETYESEPTSPIRGRASIVSLASLQSYGSPQSPRGSIDIGGKPQATSPWSGSFPYSSAGYEPVAGAGGPPSRYPSRSSRKASRRSSRKGLHESIAEEGFDLSLLGSAAPMGKGGNYESVHGNEPEGAIFDLTATLGPMGPQDEAFMKKLQEQEANGQLTGGLGTGFRPEATILGADLLQSPTSTQKSLVRSFSRRQPAIGRATTIKGLGQDEANKRGEVIEVILEEPTMPSEVDLSVVAGPNIPDDETGTMRRTTLPIKAQKTQIFYPQPNWKPFAMRWPYLLGLILLSLGLAVMQEILYQRSISEPLLRFHSPSDVPPANYIAVKFVPTIMAVAYGVLWQITDFEVKRLEAFYQLSKDGGALAGESINVDYITSFSFLRPFRAFKLRHYAVAVSSVATFLAVSLVPTFGAASLVLTPDRNVRLANPNGEKLILLHPVWSRLLSSTLGVCSLLGCLLFYLLQSRKSGLQADVKGIAGLASMAVVSHILVDFTDLDVVSHRDIHAKLKHHRYVLRNSSLAPDDENPVSSQDRDKFRDHHLSENPHPLMFRMQGYIPFMVGVLVFLGFIPAFLFTPATIVTNKAPWVVTALAVCIKLSWYSLETTVRLMEPYYILSRRHAPPKTLTLDYTAVPFVYLPIQAFINGHMLVFAVGFGSIMAEILTILLTSLASVEGSDFIGLSLDASERADDPNFEQINAGQETVLSFWITYALASFILLYMAVVATTVFARRRHPFLPRQPNTIASVLAFIHQSKMIYDFVGTSKLSNAGMVRKLDEIGKTYGLGWFEGRDGQTHCGVDQEELTGNYKHGVDYQQTNKPWNQQWDVL